MEISTTGQWAIIIVFVILSSVLTWTLVKNYILKLDLEHYKNLLPQPPSGGDLLLTEWDLTQFFSGYFGPWVQCRFYTDETKEQITARFTRIKDVEDF